MDLCWLLLGMYVIFCNANSGFDESVGLAGRSRKSFHTCLIK